MTRSPFWCGVLSGTLPLWLWAGQFAFAYGWVAAACHAGWDAPLVRGPLIAASAVTAIPAAWLLVRACASRRDGLLAAVRALCALLALIGIVWGVVPAFVLPACRFA